MEDKEFEKHYERVFKFVLPFNFPLSILVLAVCSTVLVHYWRIRGTLTNTLFLLITAADLVTCIGHVILMTCVALLSRDLIPPISATVCVVVHTILSLLGYASSVFCNTVLAALRTVKISFPFYQVEVKTLKVSLFLVFGILVSFCAIDVWYDVGVERYLGKLPWLSLWLNVTVAFVGHNMSKFLTVILHVKIPWKKFVMITNCLAGFLYLVPVGVVLVCLVTQCVVTQIRARARDHSLPVVTNWSHVNTTVFILSTIFLICNSGVAVLQLYYKMLIGVSEQYPFAVSVCQLMISTTLPLLNALLTPLVLLARCSELRSSVVKMIRRGFRLSSGEN
jgi:hypothetical protein